MAIKRLRDSVVTHDHQPSYDVYFPSFDHAIQDPVDSDIVIKSNIKIVILEGNYVLLDQSPWNQVATMAHDRYGCRSRFKKLSN
jgi:pantothenate kinase